MRVAKKITKTQIGYLKRIPIKYKLMTLEAVVLMAFCRFSILFFPFRHVAAKMGTPMVETPEEILEDKQVYAKEICWLIEKSSRYTPWESKCLVKALTALMMLKKRKIPCTLYLGMAKDKSNKLSAHAWLRCGKAILLGDYERTGFTTVAYFSVRETGRTSI